MELYKSWQYIQSTVQNFMSWTRSLMVLYFIDYWLGKGSFGYLFSSILNTNFSRHRFLFIFFVFIIMYMVMIIMSYWLNSSERNYIYIKNNSVMNPLKSKNTTEC